MSRGDDRKPEVGRETTIERVFATPWFELVARRNPSGAQGDPYYFLSLPDYACVVATTEAGDFVLVRQFRPALDRVTLEIPSGLVDREEPPEQAARRELMEETGYQAERMIWLATLTPDTGRLSNRIWCYYAPGVSRVAGWREEPGVEPVLYAPEAMRAGILNQEFDHALHVAAVLLAAWKGELKSLGPSPDREHTP